MRTFCFPRGQSGPRTLLRKFKSRERLYEVQCWGSATLSSNKERIPVFDRVPRTFPRNCCGTDTGKLSRVGHGQRITSPWFPLRRVHHPRFRCRMGNTTWQKPRAHQNYMTLVPRSPSYLLPLCIPCGSHALVRCTYRRLSGEPPALFSNPFYPFPTGIGYKRSLKNLRETGPAKVETI